MKFSHLTPTVTAAVMVVGLGLPLVAAETTANCRGLIQSTDASAQCYKHPEAAPQVINALGVAGAGVATATAGRHCVVPSQWPKGTVPAWAVMRVNGAIVGMSFDKAWAAAQSGMAWTLSLCS